MDCIACQASPTMGVSSNDSQVMTDKNSKSLDSILPLEQLMPSEGISLRSLFYISSLIP